jgi:lipopolysaccharide/colanic/teichoic acid biosynthesis glycosyltransferase
MIRILDLAISSVFLLLFLPFLLAIGILVSLSSPGGVFYKQVRIGKDGIPFTLYKFRSMRIGSDKLGLLTIGSTDSRVTKTGAFLRSTKLDEIPQFFNVLIGNMSIVGPRPEVEKYTYFYTPAQREVLSVLPGITDLASIHFRNENEILAKQCDPENFYIQEVIPLKINLNMEYIRNRNAFNYLKILFLTFIKVIRN